jgi:hypothetical protein
LINDRSVGLDVDVIGAAQPAGLLDPFDGLAQSIAIDT